MKRRLVLFDIDGTIMRDDGAAREAFGAALCDVFKAEIPLTGYDFSGRTDPAIARWVLRDAGVSPERTEEHLMSLWDSYLEHLGARISPERVHLLPGVVALLERLEQIPEVIVGLLTGNIEPGARIKLAAHDLNRFFPLGAFGSDSELREDLPPVAIDRASRLNGHRIEGRNVVIIGDSIHDIRCCRPHQATSVAVATGLTSADDLLRENPDHFFETLDRTDEVLSILMNEGESGP